MPVGIIGASHPGLTAPAVGSALTTLTAQRAAASLEGQIRLAREQLNDWVTCVSATTPKGQAEIRSLSAQISAAQERINHLQPTGSAPGAAVTDSAPAAGARLDVWA